MQLINFATNKYRNPQYYQIFHKNFSSQKLLPIMSLLILNQVSWLHPINQMIEIIGILKIRISYKTNTLWMLDITS